jgi:3-oxoacyl-[acyl-carrier-protein] synthase-3
MLVEFPDIDFSSIDLLICCTLGPDYSSPSNSTLIHERLGLLEHCCCIDLQMGCSGYIHGLGIAKSMLMSGQATNALFLTSEVPSISIHSEDLYLRMLFGDAGSATFISQDYFKRIGDFVFGTDGNGSESLYVDRSGVRSPIDRDWIELHANEKGNLQHGRMHMNGSDIVHFSIKKVPELLQQTLSKNNLTFEEIDLFIFHQASGFILSILKRKCKIPDEKFFVYIKDVGNTVSNTIPIALAEAIKQNAAKEGMKVMLLGFGIGFTWGGTVIEM